jgi:hypothetical protein
VIIKDLNRKGVSITPQKTSAPLVVDADAPLAITVTGKPDPIGPALICG